MKRGPNTLIVDDESHVRQVLGALITSIGGEVIGEAEDGEQAVALYQEHKPELVLMDINMPRIDGVEALRQIRDFDPHAQVMMLTSQNTLEVVKHCIDMGAKNYILKSNSADEILELIKQVWAECCVNSEEGQDVL